MYDEFPTNYLSAHPRHGVPRANFSYSSPLRAPSSLSLTLRIPAQRVSNKYACYVWNAALLLADRITAGEVEVRGKRVLELGAGTGLPGIVAAKMGAKSVVLSDYDDEGMRKDLEANVHDALDKGERATTRVLMHSWGSDTAGLQAAGPYELLLLADVVWDVPSHALLLASLVPLLSHQTEIIIVVGYHTGRAVVRQFFASAKEAGLELIDEYEWQEVSVEGERRKVAWVERWGEAVESQSERARWLLEGRMRLAKPVDS